MAYHLLAISLPLITTPYISRVLGPEKIGAYSYYYSIAHYFVIVIMLGLANYGNRSIAITRDNKESLNQTFSEIFIMQSITFFIGLCLYIGCGIFLKETRLAFIMGIYIFSALFDISWLYQGLELFKFLTLRSTCIKLISCALIFIFIKTTNDFYLYSIIMTTSIFTNQIVLWFSLNKYARFKKVSFRNVLRHFMPNLILFIPVAAISIYKIMDKIMLGVMSNMTEVGFYESSEKLILVPMAIITSLGTVMLPRMSYLFCNKSESLTTYIIKSTIFAAFFSSSICFGIMGVATEFVPLFFGKGYEKCVTLFYILLPSCIFLAFANVIRTQFLLPAKKDSIYIYSVCIGAFVNLILNAALIPLFNSIGAAIGTFFAELSVCIYQFFMSREYLPIKVMLVQSIPFVFTGLMMFLLLLPANVHSGLFLVLISKICFGAFIYITFFAIYLSLIKKTSLINYIKALI